MMTEVSQMKKIPVVVVAGPTASGKTALGVEICKHFSGEVVSADSMQIYKGMDIATAKPTKDEMQGIPHHLIDIISPGETFSAAKFKEYAAECIDGIVSRGNLPVIVGGTGLYIDTLVNNITLTETDTDPSLREALIKKCERCGAQAMLDELAAIDPDYAANLHPNNTKRILRALELWYSSGVRMSQQIALSRLNPSPYDVCYIVLDVNNREFLYDRINKRVDIMLEQGLVNEAAEFISNSGETSSQAIGYKELRPYFNNETSLQEAVDSLKQSTRRYAKRQLTWFRRNENAKKLYIDAYNSKKELAQAAFKIINDSGILKEENK